MFSLWRGSNAQTRLNNYNGATVQLRNDFAKMVEDAQESVAASAPMGGAGAGTGAGAGAGAGAAGSGLGLGLTPQQKQQQQAAEMQNTIRALLGGKPFK